MGRVYFRRSTNPKTYAIRNNLYYNMGRPIPASGFHDPNKEVRAVVADPRFVRPEALTGTPTLAWWDALQVKPDCPNLTARIDLRPLDLPESLRAFLNNYLRGTGDPWYRGLRAPSRGEAATRPSR